MFILLADPGFGFVAYSEVMHPMSIEFFNEPAVANPPARVARDWWLLGALFFAATMEAIFNDQLVWRAWHIALVFVIIPTVMWRRTKPLLMMAIVFISVNLSLLASFFFAEIPEGPYTAVFVLILIYALFRWGSGRDCKLGVALMFGAFFLNVFIDWGGVSEAIGGFIVVIVPAEAGAIARFQSRAAEQAKAEVRSAEREQIARELHDSIAHHVSAIAIQAQAGRAVAKTNPDAVVGALEAIEESAARTLSDMRTMVGSLRNGADAELVPQQGLQDIATLAGPKGDLNVAVAPLPDERPPAAVGAALFRIAQESVTNAVRHSSGASTVNVRVANGGDSYRLSVHDNGRRVPDQNISGYGLIGMAERARLLGGTFDAGPATGGGWLVVAELPTSGVKA